MATEAQTVVDIADQGVRAAKASLSLYSTLISSVIPWNEFKEAIDSLIASQNQYSSEAGIQVAQIQTLLQSSHANYDSSLQSVYAWCKKSAPMLGDFMKIFEHTRDSQKAEIQKNLLTTILKDGETAMDTAIKQLEQSKRSFNEASGALVTLKTTLDNDFSKGSSNYNSKKDDLRTKAYAGAAAGAAFGPIGLAIAYAIAAGKVEGEMIPAMEREFAETKRRFERLQDIVVAAQNTITEAKVSISQEIRALGTISSQIETTKTFVETWALVPELLFDPLKKSTSELINMCNEYTRSHG